MLEVPARTHRAKRRRGERRDALAQRNVVGSDERAGAVLGRNELWSAPGRRYDEGDPGVEAFQDRHRTVLQQRRDDRESPGPREMGHCLISAPRSVSVRTSHGQSRVALRINPGAVDAR